MVSEQKASTGANSARSDWLGRLLIAIIAALVPIVVSGLAAMLDRAYMPVLALVVFVVTVVFLAGWLWFVGHRRVLATLVAFAGASLLSGCVGFLIAVLTLTQSSTAIIDPMEGFSVWSAYGHPDPVQGSMSHSPGRSDDGITLSFDFASGADYLGAYRPISSSLLAGTRGIGFWYKGTGEPVTLEIKLEYADHKVFGYVWNRVTSTTDWRLMGADYEAFTCWSGSGCAVGQTVDLSQVAYVHVAVSCKSGADNPGRGTLTFDDLFTFK